MTSKRRRAIALEAAVAWWDRPHYGNQPALPEAVARLEAILRSPEGPANRRVFDLLGLEGVGTYEQTNARFACALFSDRFDGDLELLVESWRAWEARGAGR